jgi:hypothetical protein
LIHAYWWFMINDNNEISISSFVKEYECFRVFWKKLRLHTPTTLLI